MGQYMYIDAHAAGHTGSANGPTEKSWAHAFTGSKIVGAT